MADCAVELAMAGVTTALGAALAAEFGTDCTATRDIGDDIETVAVSSTPRAYIMQTSTQLAEETHYANLRRVRFMVMILVKVGDDNTARLQPILNNADAIVEATLFNTNLTAGGYNVSVTPEGAVKREYGLTHGWSDYPCQMLINVT